MRELSAPPAEAQTLEFTAADWLDVSTPVNPRPYPVPAVDPACWHEWPSDDDGLLPAAAGYYGNERLLAVGGVSAATRALPHLFPPAALACLTPMDDAHSAAWHRAGHPLRRLPTLARALAAATPKVLIANPNPLTAMTLPRATLLAAAGELDKRGGWLIVDETLADADPANSVAQFAGRNDAPRLIVLRSLAPFFGLPGARVGFVLGATDKLDKLSQLLGSYTLATPSRAVARSALLDTVWQARAREQLALSSLRLCAALAPLGETQATALFCSVATPHVDGLVEHFAAGSIRPHAAHGVVRFALPRSDAEWRRLSTAISAWKAPA